MKEITLIQCTDSKRTGSHAAKDLYDESDYFEAMKEWANARGDPWYVLSAKHGLVHPNTVVEDYDERGIDAEQAEEVATTLAEEGVETVHITAGMDYTDALIPELEKRGMDVVNHFAGERIGKRKQLLRQAAATMQHDTLC